jgi:hypothetical protein
MLHLDYSNCPLSAAATGEEPVALTELLAWRWAQLTDIAKYPSPAPRRVNGWLTFCCSGPLGGRLQSRSTGCCH